MVCGPRKQSLESAQIVETGQKRMCHQEGKEKELGGCGETTEEGE